MEPGDVEAAAIGVNKMGEDLIQGQRCGVDDQCIGRRCGEDLDRHQRTGVKANRAALYEPEPAECDQVRGAGSRANEMHCHEAARSK